MSHKVLVFLVFLNILSENVFSTLDIPVGGIFEGSNENVELAFEVAIDIINLHHTLPYYTLKPLSIHMEPDDVSNPIQGHLLDITWEKPLVALQIACSILKAGTIGIFSLLSENNSNAVQSMCDTKEVPLIQTIFETEHERECCSINLYPHPSILAEAFADLVKERNWKNFAIIYDNPRSLKKMTKIISGHNVIVRQLRLNKNGDYLDSLKEIRETGQRNFVLDCNNDNLDKILKEAQQVGMMMNDYSYVIFNLDMHTLDLTPYQHGETNITGFRLIDPTNSEVIRVAEALQTKREERGLDREAFSHLAAWELQTSTSLLVDAVMFFAEVLRDYGKLKTRSLVCNSSDSWEHGFTLFNFMKTKTFNGLTGRIEFDHYGFRTNFDLDVIELTEGGIIKTGTWNSRDGLHISNIRSDDGNLRNASFIVTVCWGEPYAMLKNTSVQLAGNDQFEGFAIDLIRELAQLEGFSYTFMHNKDNKNGDYDEKTGKWTGMIGDILDGRGDLAIADLTITRQRQQYVDFTEPFMSLGVQILYKKPTQSAPVFFSFAAPFAADVWILFGITFFGMSCMFYIIARMCPAEWFNPYPCIEEPPYLINQYDITNCMWLIIGNLMQEGADIAPRGASTRVLTSFWSFFVLIMVSSYTANMTAFLTAEKDEWPFTNMKELVKRADKLGITYGAAAGGATHKLFQTAQEGIYKTVGQYMDHHPEHIVSHFTLGVERVADVDSKYAFFMESTSIKYTTERHCNLTAVGGLLDEKYYGIAMRKNSSYRGRLSTAILKLKEMGIIDDLERKWWEKERGGGQCSKTKPPGSALALNYKHVAGIFWITIGGSLISCVVVFFELVIHIVKKIKTNQQRIAELKEELRFYKRFGKMVKPVRIRNQKTRFKEDAKSDSERESDDST